MRRPVSFTTIAGVRVLPRTVLRETAVQTAVLGVMFLLVLSLGLGIPLLHQGAPLIGILQLLPYQIAFLLPYVLPLAMTAAMLNTFGRMHEAGEIRVLGSSGITPTRLIWATFPLALALALTQAWTHNALVPDVMEQIRVNRSLVLKQGITSLVARQEPIYRNQGQVLSALATEESQLHHLVGSLELRGQDERAILYAPRARWVFGDALHLQAEDVRFLRFTPGHPERTTYARIPHLTRDLFHEETVSRQSNKPDTAPTAALPAMEVEATAELARMEQRDDIWSGHVERQRRRVRNIELAWHQRLNAPLDVLALWLASGVLGLLWPMSNRALAIAGAALLYALVDLPPIAGAKGSGKHMTFDSGWLVWPPSLLMLLIALLAARRLR